MVKNTALLLAAALLLAGCGTAEIPTQADRLASVPAETVKGTPDNDQHPPVLHSGEFEVPVPLDAVTTAGSEDSPFIPADRDEFYFFFVNDANLEAGLQVQSPVNGLWVCRRQGDGWSEPEAVVLQRPGTQALNGAPFVAGDEMYFASVREGFEGIHWFHARYEDGAWRDWRLSDFDPDLAVGELHIQGGTLYYHSERPGGAGGLDIWTLTWTGGRWQNPVNVAAVNTPADEGWPYVTPDGDELWFTRTHRGTPAVFRSRRVDGAWTEPELIVSDFAGEPTLDREGNLYFVHHYYRDGQMIEADIYVARRKTGAP